MTISLTFEVDETGNIIILFLLANVAGSDLLVALEIVRWRRIKTNPMLVHTRYSSNVEA